jgi:hypothetical protein
MVRGAIQGVSWGALTRMSLPRVGGVEQFDSGDVWLVRRMVGEGRHSGKGQTSAKRTTQGDEPFSGSHSAGHAPGEW